LGDPFHDPSGVCKKCVEIYGKIEHYQRLLSRITDERTVSGIKELLARMKARKAALHPDREEKFACLRSGRGPSPAIASPI
jgi:hypothetical protein